MKTKSNKKPLASDIIIDMSGDQIIVREESLYEKASKLISTKSKKELEDYAKKYGIKQDSIAEFLADKKPASLKEGKLW